MMVRGEIAKPTFREKWSMCQCVFNRGGRNRKWVVVEKEGKQRELSSQCSSWL